MVDEHGIDADPDRVVPPPPLDSGAPMAPALPPLAPPLSPPPASAHAAPYPSAPPASSNRLGVVLAIIGGVVALAIVGVAVAIGLFLGAVRSSSSPLPPTAVTEEPAFPSDAPSDPAPDPDSDPDADPTGIATRLEAKIDEYKRLRDSGALWQSIPDSEFNRTAVSAFLYFLTDMKVATIWGVDETQAREYDERMTMLEENLLAQEPLGDDITITLEDEVFTYDGETGEGGYTAK